MREAVVVAAVRAAGTDSSSRSGSSACSWARSGSPPWLRQMLCPSSCIVVDAWTNSEPTNRSQKPERHQSVAAGQIADAGAAAGTWKSGDRGVRRFAGCRARARRARNERSPCDSSRIAAGSRRSRRLSRLRRHLPPRLSSAPSAAATGASRYSWKPTFQLTVPGKAGNWHVCVARHARRLRDRLAAARLSRGDEILVGLVPA